jgi:hypothetical protein
MRVLPVAVTLVVAGWFLSATKLAAGALPPKADKTSASSQRSVEELPSGALVIEQRTLGAEGHPNRTLVLWMLKPEKHPDGYGRDDLYNCPDQTRGSYYEGPTRVSLVNAETGKLINTIKIKDYAEQADKLEVPYAIRKGYYYEVEGKPGKTEEARPRLLLLKDYNGDGKALEFALFDALACMGLRSTLIGYSERQDKVIQYSIRLTQVESKKKSVETLSWCDYLFAEKPKAPGFWEYKVDYRGRAGPLAEYEIRYNSSNEVFEGKCKLTESKE